MPIESYKPEQIATPPWQMKVQIANVQRAEVLRLEKTWVNPHEANTSLNCAIS